MDSRLKIVNFDEYCAKCEFKERSDQEEPCLSCLDEPVSENSHRPAEFKEKNNGRLYFA